MTRSEPSFLDNPLSPPSLARGAFSVAVADSGVSALALRKDGRAAIVSGASDAQVVAALSAHAEAPLLHFDRTEGVFGGWAAEADRQRFEQIMDRAGINTVGSWCCTSWYKPSGTFFYPKLAPTATMPSHCSPPDAKGAGGPGCARFHERRRAKQAASVLDYVEVPPDGYFKLRHELKPTLS